MTEVWTSPEVIETNLNRPESTPRLDAYNKHRRARGVITLTLEEYQDRCGWMATYRDPETPEDRAWAAQMCKAQDHPPSTGQFDRDLPPEVRIPDYVREQIESVFGPLTGREDAPQREF